MEGPVSSKDIKEYFEMVARLKYWPKSVRIFNDVFESGLSLIKRDGSGITCFGIGRKNVEYVSGGDEFLYLDYIGKFCSSQLGIGYGRSVIGISNLQREIPENILMLTRGPLNMPYSLDLCIKGINSNYRYFIPAS